MSNSIQWAVVKDHVPSNPGTVNVHHCKEGRGNDKMYVTLQPDNNTILVYCHHCHGKGRFNKRGRKHTGGAHAHRIMSYPKETVAFPSAATWETKVWHRDATHWICQYGLTDDELKDNYIAYDPSRHALLLPVVSTAGEVEVIQYRNLNHKKDGKPKYLTEAKRGGQSWFRSRGVGDPLVLTEDMLSAIKVARVTSSIALLGTSLRHDLLNHLTTNDTHGTIVVWLDDDNPQVRANQYEIAKQLELTHEVAVIHGQRQPKELTTTAITEVLSVYLRRSS